VRTALAAFRSRLVVAITLATLMTLGGAFAVIAMAVGHSQLRQLDDALLAEAIEEAGEAGQLGGNELAIDPGPGPTANDIGPLTKYGAIYELTGEVRAATPTFHGRVPPLTMLPSKLDAPFDLKLPWEHLRAVLVSIPQHEGHVLLLAAPRVDVDRDAAFLRRLMLIVFGVAVAWAIVTATWMARAFTRDHQAIASVVRRVAAGDLSARVAQASGDQPMAKLAADVNDMVACLGTLVASEHRFVAQAAHELRSPLTTLYGELSHALRRARNAEAYRDAIGEALDSTRRLRALTEDLLALSRISGEELCASNTLTLAEASRGVLSAAEEQAAPRGIGIVVSEEDAPFQARMPDIVRMLRNLLENAVRHSPDCGTVRMSARVLEESVEIAVADDGDGVPVEDRERIFEPFYRCPRDRAGTGTGLGLAIVREIARAHGGGVRVEATASGRGATFIVWIRRWRRHGAAEHDTPPDSQERARAVAGDDHPPSHVQRSLG
jgi:two-component system OmpR family sensor kinase